eukprot:SAG22_NODE_225_length_14728_cov_58.742361_17_plen_234_part_00
MLCFHCLSSYGKSVPFCAVQQQQATHGGGYIYQLCPAAKVNTGTAAEIEACFASTPLNVSHKALPLPRVSTVFLSKTAPFLVVRLHSKFAPNPHGGYSHLVIHPDPSKDFEINATIVEEGGGTGWAIHPWCAGRTGRGAACRPVPAPRPRTAGCLCALTVAPHPPSVLLVQAVPVRRPVRLEPSQDRPALQVGLPALRRPVVGGRRRLPRQRLRALDRAPQGDFIRRGLQAGE